MLYIYKYQNMSQHETKPHITSHLIRWSYILPKLALEKSGCQTSTKHQQRGNYQLYVNDNS